MLGVAAVSLVQSNDVHPARECLRSKAAHVVCIAGSVEPVEGEQRWMSPGLGLPMAMREDACVSCDIEISDSRRGQPWKVARVAPPVEGHLVTGQQRRSSHECTHV